jgi:hypothetical protein
MNIPVKEISIAFLAFIISLVAPLILVWWLFFPLAIIFIFFYDKPKVVLTAGFLLDLFYFHYPIFTIFSLVLLILSSLFRDKFRI